MTAPIRSQSELKIGPYEVYRVVTDYDALHEGFRDRVEDINIPRAELDVAGGLTPGYAAKVLCYPPIKNLGPKSLGGMLKATGMALVLVIDDARFAPLKATMTPRKRPMRRTVVSIANETPKQAEITVEMQQKMISEHMRKLGTMGSKLGKSKGGKRRLKTMKRKARQQAASHAARMRWSRRGLTHAEV